MSKLIALGYHTVGTAPAHLAVSPELFRAEMQLLKDTGYTFIQFRNLAKLKLSTKHPVLVYFDDGYKDVFVNAYPVLKDMGIKATLFVTTDFIEKKDPDIFLSWEDIREMQDVFEIGSHGVTHRKLNKLSSEEIKKELEESRRILAEKTGQRPIAVSYPHSAFNAEVQQIVKELGFTYAVGNGRGYNYGPEYQFLKKIPMSPNDSVRTFKRKLAYYPVVRFLERIAYRL